MRFSRRELPNFLSLSRVVFAFVFVAAFRADEQRQFLASTALLALAFATDFADGRLARRWDAVTKAGYFLDGLGDKVLYAAVLLVIGTEDPRQLALIWALISREMILYALRLLDHDRDLNITRLRPLSWCYAFSMWAYFAGFLSYTWLKIRYPEYSVFFSWYYICGYLALIVGVLHLTILFSMMTKST
jgi:phosphatidylglycerophosphate synthase